MIRPTGTSYHPLGAQAGDVIYSRMDGMEGLQEAKALGMLSIGLDGDYQMLLGQTVLTSPRGSLSPPPPTAPTAPSPPINPRG